MLTRIQLSRHLVSPFRSPFPLLLLSSRLPLLLRVHHNIVPPFFRYSLTETLYITIGCTEIARYFVRHSTTLITRDAHFITSRRKNNAKKVRRDKDCAKLRATPARLIGRTAQGIRKLRDQFHASPAAAMLHLLLLTALSHTLFAL